MEHGKGREATEPHCESCTREGSGGKTSAASAPTVESFEPVDLRSGIRRIAGERCEQIAKWGTNHDDQHVRGELVEAAQQLLTAVQDGVERTPSGTADWGLVERHQDPIERLTIAGALIAAEIDRLLRVQHRQELAARWPLTETALRAELARLGAELDQEKDGARRRDLALAIGRISEELQLLTGERDPADTSEDDVELCGECFEEVAAGDVTVLRREGPPRGEFAALVLGSEAGLRLYRVDDGDGELYVVARSFADAIARWRSRMETENPGEERSDFEPDSVLQVCLGGDLLLPAVARKEASDG